MPLPDPSRVAAVHLAAMPRSACIVAAGKFGDSYCLLKNRDRNYVPKVKLVHEVRDGMEVAYLKDEKTGWIEGLNGNGVGIVNAALMVSRDESERDEVERTGKKLLDGTRILEALTEKTLDAAARSIRTHKEGLKGHTVLSDGKKTLYVEMPDSNDVEYDDVPLDEVFVRTNHGVEFPDAGYVEGPREESSKNRQAEAEDVLAEVESADDVAPALLKARDDRWEPTEMVRDNRSEKRMRTTTQMVLDLTGKRLILYLLPDRVEYLGLDDRLPEDFEPEITVEVREYTSLAEDTAGESEVVTKKKASDGLLPVLDPAFNLREIFKQLVLLEDHLFHERKRCPDCIWKHLLTAEALAEEAVTLDTGRVHANVPGLAEEVRGLQRAIRSGTPLEEVAQQARVIRKSLLGVASAVKVGSSPEACTHRVAAEVDVLTSADFPEFKVGDVITYGKFQNKPGQIVRLFVDERGFPMIEVAAVGHARRKNRTMGLFRIRHADPAKRVASAWLRRADPQFGPRQDLVQGIKVRVKSGYEGVLVRAYQGAKVVGSLLAHWAWTIKECADDAAKLRDRYPELAKADALHVWKAFLDDSLHNQGIGRAMYQAAMAEGFRLKGPILFTNTECMIGSGTSSMAKRVWSSLARQYPSSGDVVAVLRAPSPGAREARYAGERKADPEDESLWEEVLAEAREKFEGSWPSPPASRWAVGRYKELGGTWLDRVAAEAVRSVLAKARYKEKKQVKTKDGDEATVYVYSERQVQNRNREKAKRVEQLRHSIDDLREQVAKDIDSDEPKLRLTALAVALIDATFERVGNDGSADEGHFGVTGWLKKHVTFGKGKATIRYVGKSGVDHEKVVDDKKLVAALKDCCGDKEPGEPLLSFGKDDDAGVVRVTSRDVNAYLEPFDVTAKDLRGYHANREMQDQLRAARKKGGKLPEDKKDREKQLKAEFKEALEATAEAVGHEAATLRTQYLVPGLEDSYMKDGTVIDNLKDASVERVASAWLERLAATRYVPLHVVRAQPYPMPEKPTRVWEWALGQDPPTARSRPMRGNGIPADENHDWKWRGSSFWYTGTGGRKDAWLLLQFGPDTSEYDDEKECSSCGARMPGAGRFCPSCGKPQKVATKTPGEREDEEAERLSRPSPKKKPPRDDSKRERMDADKDPDLSTYDKDLSLNYKDVGG